MVGNDLLHNMAQGVLVGHLANPFLPSSSARGLSNILKSALAADNVRFNLRDQPIRLLA
jgi:hypothetical protein